MCSCMTASFNLVHNYLEVSKDKWKKKKIAWNLAFMLSLNAYKWAVTMTFHSGFYGKDAYFKVSTQLVPVVFILATYIF